VDSARRILQEPAAAAGPERWTSGE
jgi:hypothetical protein